MLSVSLACGATTRTDEESDMWMFLFGLVVGGVVVALIPPEKEDRLRLWILSQWQKLNKKG